MTCKSKKIESSKIVFFTTCREIFSKLLNVPFFTACCTIMNYCIFKRAKSVRLERIEACFQAFKSCLLKSELVVIKMPKFLKIVFLVTYGENISKNLNF